MNFPPPTERQARLIWLSLTALSIVIFLAALGVLLWGLGLLVKLLASVILPVAIAGVIAYLLDPIVDLLERRRVARRLAIFLVFLATLGVTGAVLGSILPRLIKQATALIADIPAYTRQVQKKADEILEKTQVNFRFSPSRSTNVPASATNSAAQPTAQTPPVPLPSTPSEGGDGGRRPGEGEATTNSAVAVHPSSGFGETIGLGPGWEKKVTDSAVGWAASVLPKIGSWLVSQLSNVVSWVGMLIGLAMVPVFTFYFLDEKRGIVSGWRTYLPLHESNVKEEVIFVINAINDYLIVFFRGQVVVAACIGVLLMIGFWAVGLNYALLLGVMAGVLSIVPYLGAILTIVPAVSLAAIQFRDWLHPVLVVAIFVLVQMCEGLVISPKIMGDRVGLHPLTIIIAVLVGTTLMGGILGGILAIPLTAALRVIMFRYVWKRPADKTVPAEGSAGRSKKGSPR